MKIPSSTATELNKRNLRHFLSTQDFTKDELMEILTLMKLLKASRLDGAVPKLFAEKTILMIFEQPSTRTRVSFETAATLLGGHAIFLSPRDIHLGSKESLADTAQVLSRMGDLILARVNEHETVAKLANSATIPVINGLCDWLHPTQVIADIFTMMEHTTKPFDEITVSFVGDATNVCSSLSFICTKLGMEFKHIGPKKYQSPLKWQKIAEQNCKQSGGKYEVTEDIDVVKGSDFIVADSFYWVGQEDEKNERLETFIPDYVIDSVLMEKAKGALFMHCLPANDKRECTREVMESHQSIIFDEAENRLTAQMALLVYLTFKDKPKPSIEQIVEHKKQIADYLDTIK